MGASLSPRLLDDVRHALRRGDAEHRHPMSGLAALEGHARGRRHVAERVAQRRQRRAAMQIGVRERSLGAARARKGDQGSLGLGVAVHGLAHSLVLRTHESPQSCTQRDGSTLWNNVVLPAVMAGSVWRQ